MKENALKLFEVTITTGVDSKTVCVIAKDEEEIDVLLKQAIHTQNEVKAEMFRLNRISKEIAEQRAEIEQVKALYNVLTQGESYDG